MGNKLPEPLNERELDICLMKEEQRVVKAHGSVYFENLTYRCEELRSLKGEYVTLTYDPDHILTLYIYRQSTSDEAGELVGYAHAINMDTQDLSLDELKQFNKVRSIAKREHSNYDALLALDQRQKLVEQRKQEKKERQRSEQKKLRGKSKQNSNVAQMRQARASKSARPAEPMELLPERLSPEPVSLTNWIMKTFKKLCGRSNSIFWRFPKPLIYQKELYLRLWRPALKLVWAYERKMDQD
ncbi:Mu transposase C-terminal domain-containing protein [Phormidesmis priestleyi]